MAMSEEDKLIKRAEAAKSYAEAMAKRLAADEKNIETMRVAAKAAVALAEAEERLAAVQGDVDAIIKKTDALISARKAAKDLDDQYEKSIKKQNKFKDAAKGLGTELAGLVPVFGGNKDILGSFSGQLAAASHEAEGFGKGLSQVGGDLYKSMTGVQGWTNVLAASEEFIAAWIMSAIALSTEVQAVNAEFNKATGAQGAFNDQMNQAFRATTQAGVGYDEMANATQSLFTQTVKFTDMSRETQVSLMETTAVLGELGIDAGTTATNLNIMTTSLNMNATQAEETSRRLVSAAEAMGVAPGEMAADFAAAGKQFASFGENAVDAFIDLKEMAKKTGIELQSLISITEKFTTFSGAAEHVGRLNALMGGPFLNTIDMVNASLEDPAEAMMMVRDAVLDAGMSFDEMNPAMRRAVAEAAGLEDAGQLASLMAGDMESLGLASSESAEKMEDLREATKFTQDLAAELEATRLSFTANFAPIVDLFIVVLDMLQSFAAGMNKYFGKNGAAVVSLAAGVTAMVFSFMMLRGALTKMTAPVVALTTSMTGLTAAMTAAAAAGVPASAAIKGMGVSGGAAAPGMVAFATAVLMVGAGLGAVGAGIGLAAAGISMLVDSLSDLSSSADDFEKIGTTFDELSIPKMIAYTTAMSATALVGTTPAAAVIIAAGAAVGGAVVGGGEKEVVVDVSVDIKADTLKLFNVLDKRYAKKSAVSPGGSGTLPRRVIGAT